MADKTFEDYKKEAEDHLFRKKESADFPALILGLQKTFPKKPEPRDYFCMCYAYMKRAESPMQPDDLQDWGKKIKQAFKHIDDLDPKFQDWNRFYLPAMAERVPLECDEIYRMSLKALDEISKDYPQRNNLLQIQYRAADKYYDKLLQFAENPKNFENYEKNINFYENKLFDVLLHTSPSSRFEKYKVFMKKFDSLCQQSEWGRNGGICTPQMRRNRYKKMFNSLPPEIQKAIIENKNRRNSQSYSG